MFEDFVGLKTTTKWMKDIKRDAENVGSTLQVIHNREELGNQINKLKIVTKTL